MDPELIAYLDARFKETNQQIALLREDTSQRFDRLESSIDGRFEQVNGRFEQMERSTASRFEQMDSRFEQMERSTASRFERLEEATHQMGIKIEGLRDEIRQVADGVAGNNERLDAFREEVAQKFEETGTMIRLSYDDLDHRVRNLEARAS